MVTRADPVNFEFLNVGVTVKFECHSDERGLIAKKIKLLQQNKSSGKNNKGKHSADEFRPGVMT
jgi:cold shock protein